MSDALEPEQIDINALFARMAPPNVPADSIAGYPKLPQLLKNLDPIATVATLAGLQTEPQFQANLVRLDWAVRLVLALSRGARKPGRGEIHRLLNVALEEARVNVLEDPIEDFFVEPVPTPDGDFLLLSGTWEQAGFCTETVLSAFARLPDAERKRDALHWAMSLLRLSDALVRRADLERRQVGGGDPKGPFKVPGELNLRSLAKRVVFNWGELEALGLEALDFYPFTLHRDRIEELSDARPGNSVLEFRPLICLQDGVMVASPSNLTTAVRALLIDTAVQGGMGDALQRYLLETQAEAVWDSGFARFEGFPARRVGGLWLREFGREVSPGRFIHYVQAVDNFDGWPQAAFGHMRDQPELASAICEGTRAAKAAFEEHGRVDEGLTVCFLGGWGGGCSLAIPNEADLADWEFILLTPGDASAMARCDGGTVRDLWRLRKQQTLVEQQGFDLFQVNGLLNLFHWWRLTDHALVPPGWDIEPPAMIAMGTNHLLAARREGVEALDRRALPHPNGPHKIVARLDPKGYLGGLAPIYGSLDDVRGGELVAAVLAEPLTFWIHLDAGRDDPRSYDKYETWKAALNWMELVLPVFWRRCCGGVPAKSIAITLCIELPDDAVGRQLRDDEVPSTLASDLDRESERPRLTLNPEWHHALRRPDNIAEVEMATALLRILAVKLGVEKSETELRALVQEVAGSPHLRWRHTFVASLAIDVLKYHGLIGRMREIPVSAGALVKCGLAFLTRAREDGRKIEGKSACRDFLFQQNAILINRLREQIATFNKESFVKLAFAAFQAAQGEVQSWDSTARANRAIHGAREDHRGSLERINQANGVIRSASILLEIANAEAQIEGGIELGDMDFAELQALSLLVIQFSDMLPTIMGDWLRAEIIISPTGDVLTDQRFEEMTLQRSAERRHEVERARQSEAYYRRFGASNEPGALPEDFRHAIAVEYGADSEAVLDLPYALARLAANRNSGVITMSRSELIVALEAFDGLKEHDLSDLVDRLTMPVRANWEELPTGCSRLDFDISRFDRRLSLIGRPIIAFTADEDPRLAIAPAVVQRALFHNLSGALSGSLQNEFWRTREMRAFSGASGMKEGLEFNETVTNRITNMGLRAWSSAKPAWALNCKATPEVQQLGDVDVLAVSPDGGRVWVIEAKDLKLCPTMGEIARRLSEYRGHRSEKGQPDKMLRHLQRVAYLRHHAGDLVRRLGLAGIPQISGALIVRSPQPMEQVMATSPDARVVMFDDIGVIPWAEGWIPPE
jgi:hypothetical protein